MLNFLVNWHRMRRFELCIHNIDIYNLLKYPQYQRSHYPKFMKNGFQDLVKNQIRKYSIIQLLRTEITVTLPIQGFGQMGVCLGSGRGSGKRTWSVIRPKLTRWGICRFTFVNCLANLIHLIQKLINQSLVGHSITVHVLNLP